MNDQGIQIDEWPELKHPYLIAGFGGWGNALNISNGMTRYIRRKLKGRRFATINSDLFYRYDDTRPYVKIEDGKLKRISPPGGSLYAVSTASEQTDLVILEADEPSLRWFAFTSELMALCERLGIQTVISLGSMWDYVLHTDRIVSAIASNEAHQTFFKQKNILPIDYQGPSAIHTLLFTEGQKRGFSNISLWCHCPYYLNQTTHFGMLSHLGRLLSEVGGFALDTAELDQGWETLNIQIQQVIEKDPKLQDIIGELRKAKLKGSFNRGQASSHRSDKVISLQDFLDPK